MWAPKGLPKEVSDKLVAALQTALKDPKVIERFASLGTEPVAPAVATPEALKAQLTSEVKRWEPVLRVVRERLLTPVGLRSLAPGHPDYKSHYFGDLRSRDAAYHQGTVWAWLIGPYIDAWLRVYPDDFETARKFLTGFSEHLGDACIGSISEVFDADQPFIARGCVAQAWSVAEVMRCWVKTAGRPQERSR